MLPRLVLLLPLLGIPLLGTKCPTPELDAGLCHTPLADAEPLCNPSLVDSPWGTSHRASYAQASSPFAGPAPGQAVHAEHVLLPGIPIALDFSSTYGDGGTAVWGSPLGLDGAVVKIDFDPFEVIDLYIPAEREGDAPSYSAGISGAYNAIDRDDRFIVGRTRFLEVYADSVEGERSSAIGLVKRAFLPDEAFCRDDDVIAGMVLTYDDHVAFVTEQAVVGVIPRDPAKMTAEHLRVLSLNGSDCGDATVPRDALELVSNSIAADEDGGIYVVTSDEMYKVGFDGEALSIDWQAGYETGDADSSIRLGEGSGSTPSLMGTALEDDRFVVITDGQDLMHLVLFWRDAVPEDWEPIAPGKDRRIACEIPVTFGDPSAERSLSEQSVLVRGNAAVLVNNLLQDDTVFDVFPDIVRRALSALEGGNPEQAPLGIERIDWNPETRSCESVWANAELSIPNGIPTMSQATGLFYGIGQRDGVWGVEGVDFETGASKLFAPAAFTECSQEALDSINPLLMLFIAETLERLPGSCENSFYAGTEVGPDGSIVTGTFQGASKYTPDGVYLVPAIERAEAGVRQGIDLADRALVHLGESGDGDRALEFVRRGVIQLDATLEAFEEARPDAARGRSRIAMRSALVRAALARFDQAGELLARSSEGDTSAARAARRVRGARQLLSIADGVAVD